MAAFLKGVGLCEVTVHLLIVTLTLAGVPFPAEAGELADGVVPDPSKTVNIETSHFGSSRQPRQINNHHNSSLNCSLLKMGQFFCADREISEETQQAVNCSEKTWTVRVACYPVKGIHCNGQNHTGDTVGFYQDMPCQWTNGKQFSIAVLLSVFLGWLGIDRFYLGYPAIGLLKFCTFGFMFLGHLVDMLLIAIQVVGPSDGSAYVVDYYGAGISRISRDNFTYIRPPSY